MAEFFLTDSSNLTSATPLNIGRPFNSAVLGPGVSGDLTFKIGLQSGGLTTGGIEYVTPATYADFNLDGAVDGNDFLAWQRNVGKATGATLADGDADFDDDVDAADLAIWRQAYGSTTFAEAANQAATQAVPEPATAALALAAPLAAAVFRRRAV